MESPTAVAKLFSILEGEMSASGDRKEVDLLMVNPTASPFLRSREMAPLPKPVPPQAGNMTTTVIKIKRFLIFLMANFLSYFIVRPRSYALLTDYF